MPVMMTSSGEGFRKGADSGILVSGSDPDESRLLRVLGYQSKIKMPPTGKLKEEEIDLEDVFMGITKGITN